MKKTDVLASCQEIWTIDSMCFVVAIGVLTIALSIITSKGGLTDDRYKKWWKKWTKRGRISLSMSSIIVVLLVFQEINNRNLASNNKAKLDKEQNSRNTLITEAVRVNRKQLFDDLSLAMNNQGLQFDTIKNQISTIKGFDKNPNNTPPLLRISNLQIVDSTRHPTKTYKFLYEITSDDAPSYNTHVLFDVFGFTPEGKVVALDFNRDLLYKGQTVAKGLSLSNRLSIIVNYRITTYVFRLKGVYYSGDKSKIKIDDLYLLQTHNKKTSFALPSQFHENIMREFIAENNFK